MLSRLVARTGRLQRDRRGTAAVEFAFVTPFILLMIAGVLDISKAMILNEQVDDAAHTIPIMASALAVQPDKSTTLTVAQAQQSMSVIFAEIPWLRAGVETGARSVTLSSVVFQQTNPACVQSPTVTCAFAPFLAWSVAYSDANASGFKEVVRPCGLLKQTAATAGKAGDLTSLRTLGITNPDPILVVDVHYQYTPLVFTFITGPIDFWASDYWPVRSVAANTAPALQYTTYDLTNQNAGAGKCPGFD